jgi:predicted DsbA family dithiol-disulfide isomerase
MRNVTLTYYLDTLSSWCLVAEEALEKVRKEFGDRIDYEWRIAALRDVLNYSPEQLAWYYRRTYTISGMRLNQAWLQSTADGPRWTNLATEAARGLGVTDDRVRLALARGAMLDGKHMGQREIAAEAAAHAAGVDRAAMDRAMDDPQTAARIRASSEEFAKFNVSMRPTFVIRNAISDVTVLSGCWRYEPLAAALRAQLADQERYDKFMAENQAIAGVV